MLMLQGTRVVRLSWQHDLYCAEIHKGTPKDLLLLRDQACLGLGISVLLFVTESASRMHIISTSTMCAVLWKSIAFFPPRLCIKHTEYFSDPIYALP